MKAAGAKVDALDCLKLAEEAGSSKAVNIVLMGRLSHYFDLPEEAWLKSLEAMVPAKFLELNKKAFDTHPLDPHYGGYPLDIVQPFRRAKSE